MAVAKVISVDVAEAAVLSEVEKNNIKQKAFVSGQHVLALVPNLWQEFS